MTRLSILLFLFSALFSIQLIAEVGEPKPDRPGNNSGGNYNGGPSSVRVDFSLYGGEGGGGGSADVIGQSFSHLQNSSIKDEMNSLAKKIQYALYLNVSPNRGALQTEFSVPLPPNFT